MEGLLILDIFETCLAIKQENTSDRMTDLLFGFTTHDETGQDEPDNDTAGLDLLSESLVPCGKECLGGRVGGQQRRRNSTSERTNVKDQGLDLGSGRAPLDEQVRKRKTGQEKRSVDVLKA